MTAAATTFHADVRALISKLQSNLPKEVVERMITEYVEMKHKFALNDHRPSALSGGHFAETMLRFLEFIDTQHRTGTGTYTPFGVTVPRDAIIKSVKVNAGIGASFQLMATQLLPVMMDIRNRRGVGHPAGDVSPNYSDSVFLVHCADWLMTEVVRSYYACSILEATKLVAGINQMKVPVIFDHNGIVRILDASMNFKNKTLLTLYYKKPDPVSDNQLFTWVRYSNASMYKKNILVPLDRENLILRESDRSVLTTLGIKYVEKNIALDIEV